MKVTALRNPTVPKFQPIMHQIAEALKPHMTEPGMQHFFSLVMGK
jgi:hypothetical protein